MSDKSPAPPNLSEPDELRLHAMLNHPHDAAKIAHLADADIHDVIAEHGEGEADEVLEPTDVWGGDKGDE